MKENLISLHLIKCFTPALAGGDPDFVASLSAYNVLMKMTIVKGMATALAFCFDVCFEKQVTFFMVYLPAEGNLGIQQTSSQVM